MDTRIPHFSFFGQSFAVLLLSLGMSNSLLASVNQGPSYLSRTYQSFGSQRVQFLLFLVGDDEVDSDIDRIVQKRMGKGGTHEANRTYWASLSQGNDKQLVMAWYDNSLGKYQWLRIRWHRETTRVLQITNDSMSRWTNLSYGESQSLNYSVGENRYVLHIRNPPVDGGWDKNDIIYSFRVYDR